MTTRPTLADTHELESIDSVFKLVNPAVSQRIICLSDIFENYQNRQVKQHVSKLPSSLPYHKVLGRPIGPIGDSPQSSPTYPYHLTKQLGNLSILDDHP